MMNKVPVRWLLSLFFHRISGLDIPGVGMIPTMPDEFRPEDFTPDYIRSTIPNVSKPNISFPDGWSSGWSMPNVSMPNVSVPNVSVPDGLHLPDSLTGGLPDLPSGVPEVNFKANDPCSGVIEDNHIAFAEEAFYAGKSNKVKHCLSGQSLKVGSFAVLANLSNCTLDISDIVFGKKNASTRHYCDSPCCVNIAGQIERDALEECLNDYPLAFIYLTCQTYHVCDPKVSVAWKLPDFLDGNIHSPFGHGGWPTLPIQSKGLLAQAQSRMRARAARDVDRGSVSIMTAALGALSSAFIGAGVMYVVMRRGSAVSGSPAVCRHPYVQLVD